MNPPCIDCITLALCQNPRSHSIQGSLTSLANRCCMFNQYIRLKDLNLEIPPDSMSMKKRRYFTVPLAKRIIAACKVLGWTSKYDLAYYYDVALGEGS